MIKLNVLNEFETLEKLHAGLSIGRVCDGELNILQGRNIKSQDAHPRLASLMKVVLRESGKGKFLGGIVRRDSASPNQRNIEACLRPRYMPYYTASLYGSCYITRPDCAPWINTQEYWTRFEDLWRDRDVILVRGSGKSLTPERMRAAKSVLEIMGPVHNGFDEYDNIMTRIKNEGAGRRVIACLGPTATAMAYDLCQLGIHAIDGGHVGMFMRRFLAAKQAAAA